MGMSMMHAWDRIEKAKAKDIRETNQLNNGWKLVPEKAFKDVGPEILCELDPLPKLPKNRFFKDYRGGLKKKGVLKAGEIEGKYRVYHGRIVHLDQEGNPVEEEKTVPYYKKPGYKRSEMKTFPLVKGVFVVRGADKVVEGED